MSKRIPLQDYKDWVKLIRPYTTGFAASDGYDLREAGTWSSGKKAAITRYFKLIRSMSNKSHYIYRPRKKKNLEIIKKSLGVGQYKKLKVGIIQIPTDETKPEITIKKDETVSIKVRGVNRGLLPFDDFGMTTSDFLNDPLAVVDTLLAETAHEYRYYTVMAGEFEVGFWQQKQKGIPRYFGAKEIGDAVMALINEYDADKHNPNDPNSSYYGNWLRGLIGYKFEERSDFKEYKTALREYKYWVGDINKKIMRGKSQIKIWEKELRSVKRKIRIPIKEKKRKIKLLQAKISDKKISNNNLLYAKIKENRKIHK